MWTKKRVNLNPEIEECADMMRIDPSLFKKLTGIEKREDSPILASLPAAKEDYFREAPDVPKKAFRFMDLFALGFHYAVQASMEEIEEVGKDIVMPVISPFESDQTFCTYNFHRHTIGISTGMIKQIGKYLDRADMDMNNIRRGPRPETVNKLSFTAAQESFLAGVEEARHAIFFELEKARGVGAIQRQIDENKSGIAKYDTTAEKDAEAFLLRSIADLGLGKAVQPRTNMLDRKYAAKVVKESRETARTAIRTLINEGGKTADFVRHLDKRIKQSIAEMPEDSEGKRFMVKAAEQMNTADYLSMVYEILILQKVNQPINDTLAHYNTWHAKEHSMLPEKPDENAVMPSNRISRRKAIGAMVAAAGFVSLAGGMGTKMLAPEQVNDDHKVLINTAIVGGMATSVGVTLAQLMTWDQLTADSLIKAVDQAVRTQTKVDQIAI